MTKIVVPCTNYVATSQALCSPFGEVYNTENPEDYFPAFKGYHYQAMKSMSDHAVMAGFLMLRLKRCVGPTPPYDAIIMDVVLPAVRLTSGERVALLPAIIINIQSGLRMIIIAFCNAIMSGPQTRMAYTYLDGMVCNALHTFNVQYSFMRRYCSINASSKRVYMDKLFMLSIRQMLRDLACCRVYKYSPKFSVPTDDAMFKDAIEANGFIFQTLELFRWLINIRLGYHVSRHVAYCMIKLYTSSRFAR